jgi:small subunit ribosomal protein S6
MFLLDTNKVAGDVNTASQQLHGILERNHAEVLASRPWDERRLAYPIRNHKKGLYYLVYFRSEGKNIVGIERDIALNEMILRMMILNIEPKLVDAMLALARDEHSAAVLQTVTEPPDDEHGEEDRGPRGRGPRGGGREGREPREPREARPAEDKDA